MEEPSVCVDPEGMAVTPDSPSRLRSTMSTPKSPSDSSDDCDAPEYKCAICLGRLRNKSLIDSCFHEFCFECLVEWSKIKPECPLCKTKFEYIVHNVKSNDDYEKYHCQSNQEDNDMQIPWADENRSFRYRTTMAPRLQERLAMQQIVALREQNTSGTRTHISRRYGRNSQLVSDFRNRVYRDNLWVQPLCDITNRFRECSPLFYRENPAQVYRLVRWLQRELMVLLPLNCPHRTFVMQTIINNVFQHPIRSNFFSNQLQPYLGVNTRHFIHEFAEYARSPFDMTGHDRAATYLPTGPPRPIEEVILNSPTSSEYSIDLDEISDSSNSDVEIIEDNSNTSTPIPVAGPSGVRFIGICRRPRIVSGPIMPLSNEGSHEILSSSSSDECEIIGTFKPPTPEVIDILSSDVDTPQNDKQETPSCSVDLEPISQDSLSESAEDRTCDTLESSHGLKLMLKIGPNRLKELKKRSGSNSDDYSNYSVSPSLSSSSLDSSALLSKRKDTATSKSESYNRPARIPSVVVPQPSFKLEASSSKYISNNEDASEADSEVKEKPKKRKRKHSKKHKRSRRHLEEKDRDEGTSESSSSKRCKVCRHRHCRCNRESSKKRKRIKVNRRESPEEWDSTSGSSRSKSKIKWERQTWQSDSRYSDSSD